MTNALTLNGLTKSFGGVRVLHGVSLTVRPGSIHALLGGNGSGKSTTIKILAGVYTADDGELNVQGERKSLDNYGPSEAERAGLRFVHQDLGLFDDLSVQENFALASGYPKTSRGTVDWQALRTRVASIIEAYGIAADPHTPVNRLRPADRTLLAIARALQDDESGRLIVVLDEPTASLGSEESSALLERVRARASLGQTFIIVSHRLPEVMAVADDFTVFRDGRVAAQLVSASPTEEELIAHMAGGSARALLATGSAANSAHAPLLSFHGIGAGRLSDVTLTLHEGEIVGLAGLAGSGRSTLLGVAFGRVRPAHGHMVLSRSPFSPRSVAQAMDAGIALVPEDRAREAAFPDMSVTENLWITVLKGLRRRGRIDRRQALKDSHRAIATFNIKVAGPSALFSSMSGGNQQKTVLARWLQREPRVLLLDEPTQGVDAMSRAEIYDVIRESTGDSNGVLIASSDLAELHALCDRILVLADGQVTWEVAAAEVSLDELTALVLTNPTTEERKSA